MNRKARGHRVNSNPVLSRFHRGASRECHNTSLGRRIMRLPCLCAPTQNGSVVHDHAGTSLHHVRQHGTRHSKHAVQRDVHDGTPLIVGHIDDRNFSAESGIIDHHVDMAHLLRRSIDQCADVIIVPHIAKPVSAWLPRDLGQLLCGFRCASFMDVTDKKARALFRTSLRRRETYPGSRRGSHEHRLALQEIVRGDIVRCRQLGHE